MNSAQAYQLLADLVLVTHVGVVLFVVLGLLLIVVGNLLGWGWVNNIWLRIAHIGTIAVVVLEAWLGVVCPLTTLEMWLRAQAGVGGYAGGFVEYWLQRLLYYDAPARVFLLLYSLFGAIVAATFWWFPPRWPRRDR